MDYQVTASTVGDVVVVAFSGQVTEKNAPAMTKKYFDLVLESGQKKVLADIRALKGRLSSGSTYFLVRNLPVSPVPEGIKTAVVDLKEDRGFAEFLETTAANAGVHLKHFFDYEEALSWLRS
jgi:hypothetical protein